MRGWQTREFVCISKDCCGNEYLFIKKAGARGLWDVDVVAFVSGRDVFGLP